MEKESLVDEYLAGFLDYRSMKICAECFQIYGACIDRRDFRSYYHKCHSTKPDMPPGEINQEKWERFDFNEIVTLCHCCGQEILMSGSKWSVWFCDECKKRTIDFHEKYQIWVFPIGRHSLMNRVGLNAKDIQREEQVKEFLSNMRKLFDNMDQLRKWHKINMLNNFRALGYLGDVLLTDYLIQTRELSSKSQAFQNMGEFFGVPNALIRDNKEQC